jgi:hypothetical protein
MWLSKQGMQFKVMKMEDPEQKEVLDQYYCKHWTDWTCGSSVQFWVGSEEIKKQFI